MTYAAKLRTIPDLDDSPRRCLERLATLLEDSGREDDREGARSMALAYLAGYADTGPSDAIVPALLAADEALR